MKTKYWIKRTFPFVPVWWARYKNIMLKKMGRREVFTRFYKTNRWKSENSRSGPGSELEQTIVIRDVLPRVIEELDIRSLLDIPCGDYHWMQHVQLNVNYIGADIVEEAVAANAERYSREMVSFRRLDLVVDELPEVDMVFCRDCLVHLSNEDALNAFENIVKSKSKYLLVTTFPDTQENLDIPTGRWRRLNMQKPPFNLGEPIALVNEQCPVSGRGDKSMGLWQINY